MFSKQDPAAEGVMQRQLQQTKCVMFTGKLLHAATRPPVWSGTCALRCLRMSTPRSQLQA